MTTRIARLKDSAEAGGTYLLRRVVGVPRFARPVAVAVLEQSTSAVVTRVPGPRQRLTIGAYPINDLAFSVPTPQSAACATFPKGSGSVPTARH